jgi:hypothetical protein
MQMQQDDAAFGSVPVGGVHTAQQRHQAIQGMITPIITILLLS